MMSGPGSRAELSDKDLVESVLRDLSDAADKCQRPRHARRPTVQRRRDATASRHLQMTAQSAGLPSRSPIRSRLAVLIFDHRPLRERVNDRLQCRTAFQPPRPSGTGGLLPMTHSRGRCIDNRPGCAPWQLPQPRRNLTILWQNPCGLAAYSWGSLARRSITATQTKLSTRARHLARSERSRRSPGGAEITT